MKITWQATEDSLPSRHILFLQDEVRFSTRLDALMDELEVTSFAKKTFPLTATALFQSFPCVSNLVIATKWISSRNTAKETLLVI